MFKIDISDQELERFLCWLLLQMKKSNSQMCSEPRNYRRINRNKSSPSPDLEYAMLNRSNHKLARKTTVNLRGIVVHCL